MIVFACISPHAPIFLPTVGSPYDREKIKSTISNLKSLAPKLEESKPNLIIISSPHKDWGINVPAYFILSRIKNYESRIVNYQVAQSVSIIHNSQFIIQPVLTTPDSPKQHYAWGQEITSAFPKKLRLAWIASGDMSHTLKKDGPYGFNPVGPEFDKKFIDLLKKKDVRGILDLDSDPNWLESAGQCGLNSFCILLGALKQSKINWTPKILSYEGSLGVGYLVANFLMH